MSHFKLLSSDDIHNGPVDYSTPIGSTDIYACSRTANAALDAARPAGKTFRADSHSNAKWFFKFNKHVDLGAEICTFKKGPSGKWYVQAVAF